MQAACVGSKDRDFLRVEGLALLTLANTKVQGKELCLRYSTQCPQQIIIPS